MPSEARIPVVLAGNAVAASQVRQQYKALAPLSRLNVSKRGWTLDVLRAIEGLHKPEFTLADAYSTAPHLAKLHPANRHVEPKIRQQLQVLRDLGLVEFLGGGRYRQ